MLLNYFNRLLRCSALLLLLTTEACQQQGLHQRPAPLPQDPLVQVYFNHEQSSEYTDPYRHQTRPGDDLEKEIVDTIATAHSTVDLAVMELRLPKIAQALVDRQKAGVKVRVILDKNYSRPLSVLTPDEVAKLPSRDRDRYDNERQLSQSSGDAVTMLRDGGVPIIDNTANGSRGSVIMHHKFINIDGQALIVTSANFTIKQIHGAMNHSESQGDANNLVKIESPQLATLFTQEFNLMWGDGPGGKPDTKNFGLMKPFRPIRQVKLGDTTIEVDFSPTSRSQPWEQSGNGLIGKTLSTASQSVDMALFVFSEQHIANILETEHQRGVEERALISRDFAYRPYSQGLAMQGVASHSCKFKGVQHLWQNPIKTVGVPELPQGELLHHKFAVIDRQTVITGSHNWSEAANSKNDETLLVIHNSTVAAHFEREFERLYTNAEMGVPATITRKIQLPLTQCATYSAASRPDRDRTEY